MQPAQAFEDRFPIKLHQLEAIPLVADRSQGDRKSAFPYPWLTLTANQTTLEMPSVVLENEYLRATFLPELGGRMISLFDKRTQTEMLSHVPLQAGGVRGVHLPWGFEFSLTNAERPNSLGPVDYQFLEEDESGSASVVFGELPAGSPLSWHWFVTLPAGACELLFEVRVQNRSWDRVPYAPQFRTRCGVRALSPLVGRGQGVGNSDGAFRTFSPLGAEGAGGGENPEPENFLTTHTEPGEFRTPLRRNADHLGPLEVDVFTLRLGLISKMAAVTATDPFGTLGLTDDRLFFQAARPAPGAKILLQTASGQTLEAAADLYPERTFEAEITGLGVKGVVILSAERHELFRWPAEAISAPIFDDADAAKLAAVDALRGGTTAPGALRKMREETGLRPLAEMFAALFAMQAGDFARAEAALEDFLGRNAESPLGWWYLAIVRRHLGHEGERPELLNAHFLAPLEPLLRAESYLANPSSIKEPSALVAPLASSPDAMIEVAVRLYDAGLFEDLTRWTDEALRHREIPMLRYLLAEALLRGSRMEAEAAQHLAKAGQTPVNPPYPWRETELFVLANLQRRFPSDVRIADLLELALWARS
jgi:hypothetical protein